MQRKSLEKKPRRSFWFYLLKWLLVIAIAYFSLNLLSKPLRKRWSLDYLQRGDILLEQKHYLSAKLEYKKSIALNKNEEAIRRIDLASKASLDILQLEDFYKERNLSIMLEKVNLVKNLPDSEIQSVRTAKGLIELSDFQLATIAADHAIEIDQKYRDGWLYLGIANLKCAQNLELDTGGKNNYLNKAKEALSQAQNIDPAYQPTKDYLAETSSQ